MHLVNTQWALLGEKAMHLHRIKLIHSTNQKQNLLVSDMAHNNIKVKRYDDCFKDIVLILKYFRISPDLKLRKSGQPLCK